jgi:hypothetical protein
MYTILASPLKPVNDLPPRRPFAMEAREPVLVVDSAFSTHATNTSPRRQVAMEARWEAVGFITAQYSTSYAIKKEVFK